MQSENAPPTSPLLFSGNISVGLSRHSSLDRIWTNDVFVGVFRDLEDRGLHFYASLRGAYVSFKLEYLGKVPVLPSLSQTADARFQRSTRRQAGASADSALAMSLKAACRYTITKLKARSYVLPLSQFTFGMNACGKDPNVYVRK